MTLDTLLSGITGPDTVAMSSALRHWDSLAKPLGSLGVLEENLVQIAGLTGSAEIHLDSRCMIVLCGDNGVIAQGVSQSDASVTTAVAAALGQGTSTVNFMAEKAGCRVLPVNIGMAEPEPIPGVLQCSVRKGTEDITLGPAMSREECIRAILTGADLVRCEKEQGTELICVGEMGIGNTTTTAAVTAVLLHTSPEILTGRGAGLSDEGLARKLHAVQRAIAVNAPNPQDPIDVLAKVGGLDLAGLCGICLGGAYYGVPVLLDGVITNAAALCAVRLCPNSKKALLASHVSTEPAAGLVLKALGLKTMISAGLHLGEGSGAVLALSLLDQALAVYNSGHTFGHLGIEAYTPQ